MCILYAERTYVLQHGFMVVQQIRAVRMCVYKVCVCRAVIHLHVENMFYLSMCITYKTHAHCNSDCLFRAGHVCIMHIGLMLPRCRCGLRPLQLCIASWKFYFQAYSRSELRWLWRANRTFKFHRVCTRANCSCKACASFNCTSCVMCARTWIGGLLRGRTRGFSYS